MKSLLVLSALLLAVSTQAQTTRRSSATHTRVSTRTTAYSNSSANSSSTRLDLPSREEGSTRPTLEIKGGAGFATVSQSSAVDGFAGETNDGIGSRTGLNFGVFVNLPTSPLFSFNPGIQFIQKGAKVSQPAALDGGSTGTFEQSTKVNYLEIPLLARLNFGERSVRFNVAAGPYAAFKMSASTSAQFTPTNGPSQNLTSEAGDVSGLSSTDFGLRAGAGVSIPMSESVAFLLGADYDFGLKSIAPANAPSTKTRTLVANVGLGVTL